MTNYRRLCPWVACATLAFAPGCGNEQPDKSAPVAVAPAPPPPLPGDKSLTPAEYVQLGMPPPDREWAPDDMAKAANVLAKLCQDTPAKLPRYQSPRSGAVFARITSDENRRFFANDSPPTDVSAKTGLALAYFKAIQQIMQLYLARNLIDNAATEESIELSGCVLRMPPTFQPLVERFFAAQDPKDPTYPVRKKGFEELPNSYATMLKGAFIMFGDSRGCPEASRARLLGLSGTFTSRPVPRAARRVAGRVRHPAPRVGSRPQARVRERPAPRVTRKALGEVNPRS